MNRSSSAVTSSSAAGSSSALQDCANNTPACGPGTWCSPSGACLACDTPDHCGSTCGSCRSLPGTLHEREAYQCNNNTAALNVACQVTTCASALANCDGDDVNGCEINITTDPVHCGSCATTCPSGSCTDRRCDCPTTSPECPWNQTCTSVRRCSCENNDGRCDPVEDSSGDDLYVCGGTGNRYCIPR